MKYLIINGSPHRGNTWTVVQAAIVNAVMFFVVLGFVFFRTDFFCYHKTLCRV